MSLMGRCFRSVAIPPVGDGVQGAAGLSASPLAGAVLGSSNHEVITPDRKKELTKVGYLSPTLSLAEGGIL